jgi:putative redox protein
MSVMTVEVLSRAEDMTARHETHGIGFVTTERRVPGSPSVPTPLEMLLGALTGCMNVVAWMVAQERGWALRHLTFQAQGALDPRGLGGDPAVSPQFHTVDLAVTVSGDIDDATIAALREEVERRCPVHRTLEAAGVTFREQWSRAD